MAEEMENFLRGVVSLKYVRMEDEMENFLRGGVTLKYV
jgi:hypothetical protein